MKYCEHCGSQLNDDVHYCPYCGNQNGAAPKQPNNTPMYNNQQPQYNNQNVNYYVNDTASFGYVCLGFCFPIVGLILFLVWHDTRPKTAKSAGIAAAVSVGLTVLMYVILFLIGMSSVE